MATSSAPPMVDYVEFDPARVSNLSPREKEWKNDTGSGKFKELPLMYDYSTPDHKKTDKLYMQYPEVKIPRGIQEKLSQSGGYNEYSVMLVFDMSNPEHVRVIKTLSELYIQIANLIGPIKGALGLPYFNPDTPEASGLGSMVYISRDKITSEVLEGKDPTQFYKMYKNTVFADLTGKSIDHNILKDAEIVGYPLVCHTHVYIGTKVTIKSHLQSFIVTGLKKSDGLARQVSTIGRVLEQNPGAQASLESQIAALMGDTQDVLIQQETQVPPIADVLPVIKAAPIPAVVEQTAPPNASQVPAVVPQTAPQVPQTAPQVPAVVEQAAPAQAPTQDLQAFLAQSTPQTVPAQPQAAQTVPAQPQAAQTIPAQTVPAQTVPAQTVPAQAAVQPQAEPVTVEVTTQPPQVTLQ